MKKTLPLLCNLLFILLISCSPDSETIDFNELPIENIEVPESVVQKDSQTKQRLPEGVYLSPSTNKLAIRNDLYAYISKLHGDTSYLEMGDLSEQDSKNLLRFIDDFICNKRPKSSSEFEVNGSGIIDDTYKVSHEYTTISELKFEWDIQRLYADSSGAESLFMSDEYPYAYNIPDPCLQDTMTYYRYYAMVDYHLRLEMENKKGEDEVHHLVYSMGHISTLYSPFKLVEVEEGVNEPAMEAPDSTATLNEETPLNEALSIVSIFPEELMPLLQLEEDFELSTTHDPYQIHGYFDSDSIIDVAFFIREKFSGKDGLVVSFGKDVELYNVFGAGTRVLGQGFDDFNWAGVFKIVPRGGIHASNVDNEGEIATVPVPDSLKTTLPNDGIFVHALESCGGGIIYLEDSVFHWIQQE